jgi:hypothetical protein
MPFWKSVNRISGRTNGFPKRVLYKIYGRSSTPTNGQNSTYAPRYKPLTILIRAIYVCSEVPEKGPEFLKLKRVLPFRSGLFYENTI